MTRDSSGEIVLPISTLRRVIVTTLIAALALIALLLIIQQRERLAALVDRGLAAHVETGTYQAVFLSGGSVYFGKLSVAGDYVLLSDVFYLPEQDLSPSEAGAAQLIKRGNELHGPSEPMIIPLREVIFIENLKVDAAVVTAIRRYHSGAPGSTAPPPTARPTTPRPASPSPR